jgi:hypothetical protein
MMKLQFDPNQPFQLDAVAAITDLFDGQPQGAPEYAVINVGAWGGLFGGQERTELGAGNRLLLADDKLLTNTRTIQTRNDIEVADPAAPLEAWELFDSPANQARLCPHFSVEMETGTGKTYVYLRTIFELSRCYGFQKFIIVVPSVAIRKGVLKNIEITAEHFRALYNNLPFEHFVYDARKVNRLRQFATSNTLQILVINIDGSRTSGLRRMFRDLSRAVCIVCISRACALRTGCPHRARPGDPPSERTPAALHHAHRPASGVRPSAPGATAAPGSATLLATTRRAPASRRPAPGDTAAPPWRRHGHWGLQGAAMAGVNGRGAGQRGERSGTAPADRASRLRPGPGCALAAPPPRCRRARGRLSPQAVVRPPPPAGKTCSSASGEPTTTRCVTPTRRRRRYDWTTGASSSAGRGIHRGWGLGPLSWRRAGRLQWPQGARHAGIDARTPAVHNRGTPPGATPATP